MELAPAGRLPRDRAQLGLDAAARRRPTPPSCARCAARSTPPQRAGSGRSSPSTRFSADTPLTPQARPQFAAYAASILRELPERARRDRRQRAQPRPCSGGRSSGRTARTRPPGLPVAARRDLRRAQGGRSRRERDRRLARRARRRQPGRPRQDALADALHRRSRRRLPRERPRHEPVHRHVLDPPVSRRTRASRRPSRTRDSTAIGIADYDSSSRLLEDAFGHRRADRLRRVRRRHARSRPRRTISTAAASRSPRRPSTRRRRR